MNQITESIVTIAVAVIGLAIVAVLVSRNAATSSVIGSAGQAFSSALSVATSPVTGSSGFDPSFGVGGGFSFGGNVFN